MDLSGEDGEILCSSVNYEPLQLLLVVTLGVLGVFSLVVYRRSWVSEASKWTRILAVSIFIACIVRAVQIVADLELRTIKPGSLDDRARQSTIRQIIMDLPVILFLLVLSLMIVHMARLLAQFSKISTHQDPDEYASLLSRAGRGARVFQNFILPLLLLVDVAAIMCFTVVSVVGYASEGGDLSEMEQAFHSQINFILGYTQAATTLLFAFYWLAILRWSRKVYLGALHTTIVSKMTISGIIIIFGSFIRATASLFLGYNKSHGSSFFGLDCSLFFPLYYFTVETVPAAAIVYAIWKKKTRMYISEP